MSFIEIIGFGFLAFCFLAVGSGGGGGVPTGKGRRSSRSRRPVAGGGVIGRKYEYNGVSKLIKKIKNRGL